MPHHIRQQTFQYDALGNITSCTTQFVEGDQNTATYTYERSSGKDPCQLQSVAHSHADYPKQITLTYDAGGRLQADEHSRTLSYDACGRLASIAAGASLPAASYQYDAFDRLVEQTIGADTTSLYYRASALVNQLTGADTSQHQRFIGGGIAQSTNETSPKTWLTGSDNQRNVLLTEQGETRETQTYSPYGYREPDAKTHSKLGYTGERRDPASGVYHLGNGYRSYNPTLMRFTAPDSWSPFGAGGINPYAYCAGDPISRADPSGHMSLGGWIGLGLGIVGGIAVGILTDGAALPAVVSLIATAVADATVGVATQMTAMAIDRERLDSLGAGGWGSIVGLSAVGTLSGWGLGKLARAGAARAATSRGGKWTTETFKVSGGGEWSGNVGMMAGEASTSRAGAATSGTAVGLRRPDNVMAYIEENFTHKMGYAGIPNRIRTARIGREDETYFINEYYKDKWIFISNYRASDELVFASDITEYQFKQVAKKLGFSNSLPNEIMRIGVTNEQTLSTTQGKMGEELFDAFFSTPNGKSTKRIMDAFGLKTTSVVRDGKDFHISVERVNPISRCQVM